MHCYENSKHVRTPKIPIARPRFQIPNSCLLPNTLHKWNTHSYFQNRICHFIFHVSMSDFDLDIPKNYTYIHSLADFMSVYQLCSFGVPLRSYSLFDFSLLPLFIFLFYLTDLICRRQLFCVHTVGIRRLYHFFSRENTCSSFWLKIWTAATLYNWWTVPLRSMTFWRIK
jgi:hypothetical protein